ncbi:GNAT family N-acetyltransferase [Virgibacillus kekensis]|uniref:GNAT family N-acetyltransferase n=1 Tax=Virgibacillus kekensis TaxID=202261 RepID=A0ABV9DMS0_9BACI
MAFYSPFKIGFMPILFRMKLECVLLTGGHLLVNVGGKIIKEKFMIEKETKRLLIRPLSEGDYDTWLEGFSNRLPSHHRHDQGEVDTSKWDYKGYVDVVRKHQKLALDDTAYIFAIFRKKDGTHLGFVDFSTLMREEFQWAAIGYSIHNQYWGNGYGKEAAKKGIEIAFRDLGYHRLEAHINLDNPASVSLAKSIGMQYECTRKDFIFEFGEWTDNLIYIINAN